MTIADLSIDILAAGFERMFERCSEIVCDGCGKTVRGAHRRRWCAPCEDEQRYNRANAPEKRAEQAAAARRRRSLKAA